MSAEGQTIPDDIFQTACGIVMEAKSLKSMLRHKDVVDAIASALFAERKRFEASLEEVGVAEKAGDHLDISIDDDLTWMEGEKLFRIRPQGEEE